MRHVLIAPLLLLVPGAFAQEWDPHGQFHDYATSVSAEVDGMLIFKEVLAREKAGLLPKPPRAGAPAVSTAGLSFTPSAALRQQHYARFVARTRAASPASADSLAATLRSDPIARMGPELKPLGLSTNNIADAYAIYWVEAWEAAHGTARPPSRALAQAVRGQVAAMMQTMPAFAKASHAEKQELADALLVQALLVGAGKQSVAGNPTQQRAFADAVRKGARAFGLDLDAVTLTDNGFVPATETGAATPRPDGQGQSAGMLALGAVAGAALLATAWNRRGNG